MRLLDQTQDEILDLLSQQENTFLCNILIYHAGKGSSRSTGISRSLSLQA
jgi:hypothetical protein